MPSLVMKPSLSFFQGERGISVISWTWGLAPWEWNRVAWGRLSHPSARKPHPVILWQVWQCGQLIIPCSVVCVFMPRAPTPSPRASMSLLAARVRLAGLDGWLQGDFLQEKSAGSTDGPRGEREDAQGDVQMREGIVSDRDPGLHDDGGPLSSDTWCLFPLRPWELGTRLYFGG